MYIKKCNYIKFRLLILLTFYASFRVHVKIQVNVWSDSIHCKVSAQSEMNHTLQVPISPLAREQTDKLILNFQISSS